MSKILWQDECTFKFKLSSRATEMAISVLLENKDIWVDPRSFNIVPGEACSLIAKESMPFMITIVLSNVMPHTITISFKTQNALYRIEDTPLLGMCIASTPTFLTALLRILKGKKMRLRAINIAYRNILRQRARFLLTVLGITIPTTMLTITLTQTIIGVHLINISGVEASFITVFLLATLIGGFQVTNTIFTSILERVKEIGVMKAIGFQPAFINKMILFETILIGLVSGAVGATVGVISLIAYYNPIYGISLPNDVVALMMSNVFGAVDITKPQTIIENPWYRNYILAMCILSTIYFVVYSKIDSCLGAIFTVVLFAMFLRPIDPSFIKLILQIFPFLALNIFVAMLFSVGLCCIAGFLTAKKVSEISVAEAMRHE